MVYNDKCDYTHVFPGNKVKRRIRKSPRNITYNKTELTK
jgi:hypothetical protein